MANFNKQILLIVLMMMMMMMISCTKPILSSPTISPIQTSTVDDGDHYEAYREQLRSNPSETVWYRDERYVSSETEFQEVLDRLRLEADGLQGPLVRRIPMGDYMPDQMPFEEIVRAIEETNPMQSTTQSSLGGIYDRITIDGINGADFGQNYLNSGEIESKSIEDAPAEPEVKNYEDCPICLEPMSETSGRLTNLICGHNFHRVCIKRWKYVSDSSISKCPICRCDTLDCGPL